MARLLFLSYVAIRFLLGNRILAFNPYATYFFDTAFIVFISLIYKKDIPYKIYRNKIQLVEFPVIFIFGMAIFMLSQIFNWDIPVNFRHTESIIFLIIISPILEELLFRQSFIHIFKNILNNPWYIIITTALLFSLSHYYTNALNYPGTRQFIIFQTVYTFGLGIWLGWRYLKTKSILHVIILHFFLNLGFGIAGYLFAGAN